MYAWRHPYSYGGRDQIDDIFTADGYKDQNFMSSLLLSALSSTFFPWNVFYKKMAKLCDAFLGGPSFVSSKYPSRSF